MTLLPRAHRVGLCLGAAALLVLSGCGDDGDSAEDLGSGDSGSGSSYTPADSAPTDGPDDAQSDVPDGGAETTAPVVEAGPEASMLCSDFLVADPTTQQQVTFALAGAYSLPDYATPNGVPSVTFACAQNGSSTVGQIFDYFSTH